MRGGARPGAGRRPAPNKKIKVAFSLNVFESELKETRKWKLSPKKFWTG